jgi:hypothetical protein
MDSSRRTGVRFVLTNPSDPSRLDEFNDWYDTYSAALTVAGYLASDAHFQNPDASGGKTSPRYATIYDIVTPDPATAWPDTEHSPAYPTHLFSDPRAKLVAPALRASYALVGSQLRPGQHGPLTGIHVILPSGAGDTERQHREAQILQTGLFYSAARFRLIEGSPTPPNGSRYSRPTTPTPSTPTPSSQPHAARTADPPPAERVVPPSWRAPRRGIFVAEHHPQSGRCPCDRWPACRPVNHGPFGMKGLSFRTDVLHAP